MSLSDQVGKGLHTRLDLVRSHFQSLLLLVCHLRMPLQECADDPFHPMDHISGGIGNRFY